MSVDLALVVTAHDETAVSGPTMRSADRAVAAAREAGYSVQPLLALDAATEATTAYFGQSCFDHWERQPFDEGDLGRVRNTVVQQLDSRYVAFLDADDVWLPNKLERQVSTLESRPDVGMVYGRSQWWFSWTGRPEDLERDYLHRLGLPAHERIGARELLSAFFLRQDAAIPGPSSIMIRREAALAIGGFEEQFTGAYDDQAFYAKVVLSAPVIASDECLDRYRQHRAPQESTLAGLRRAYRERLRFLDWLDRYSAGHEAVDRAVRRALRRERWRCRALLLAWSLPGPVRAVARTVASGGRRLLPAIVPMQPGTPAPGRIRFGDLRRVVPISRQFGYERGQPIDRHYIEAFLADHAADIRGRALEVGDDTYTRRFGGDRVKIRDVLHVIPGIPGATIIGDLRRPGDLPVDAYDCVILTQTLQFIDDAPAALDNVGRALKPGGVLLATLPGIGQVSRYDADAWGYFDSYTTASARRLFETAFPPDGILVRSYGNVLAATAFLYGVSAGELSTSELDHPDDDYQVIVAVRAVKPSTAVRAR